MSKPSSRARTNGAYVIKSAESRPHSVKVTSAHNGRISVATPKDKKLVEAIRQHRKGA